jgi:ribonuclease P protein component
MLPKQNRLRKNKDFENIFKNSKSLRSAFVVFKTTKNNVNLNRFGFVVSCKISKKATIRNKVRRRLAEIVAALSENMKKGNDVILIAMPGIEKKDFSETKRDIISAFIKLGLTLKEKNV